MAALRLLFVLAASSFFIKCIRSQDPSAHENSTQKPIYGLTDEAPFTLTAAKPQPGTEEPSPLFTYLSTLVDSAGRLVGKFLITRTISSESTVDVLADMTSSAIEEVCTKRPRHGDPDSNMLTMFACAVRQSLREAHDRVLDRLVEQGAENQRIVGKLVGLLEEIVKLDSAPAATDSSGNRPKSYRMAGSRILFPPGGDAFPSNPNEGARIPIKSGGESGEESDNPAARGEHTRNATTPNPTDTDTDTDTEKPHHSTTSGEQTTQSQSHRRRKRHLTDDHPVAFVLRLQKQHSMYHQRNRKGAGERDPANNATSAASHDKSQPVKGRGRLLKKALAQMFMTEQQRSEMVQEMAKLNEGPSILSTSSLHNTLKKIDRLEAMVDKGKMSEREATKKIHKYLKSVLLPVPPS